ncbi:hypothetical protein BH20ACI4_BH20ACI4_19400 [soil metagenome]
MPEVLEIQQSKNTASEIADDAFSWKVELPDAVKKENNLSENSYLVLTVHNGKISGELINITPEIKNEAGRITGKYRKAFEELKRLGD